MTGRSLGTGILAYAVWGLFPLYWPLLDPAGPLEILAHRMVWSLVVMVVLTSLTRRWRALAGLRPRTLALVVAAAVLIGVNWGVYIYAVNAGLVVDAALGYFINPLLSVLLGVVFFGERLRTMQWVATALGAAAVVVIAVAAGRPPWIALILAVSFGCYGLVKKVVPLSPSSSLTAEGAVLVLPALVYLAVLQAHGTGTFVSHGAGHTVLLISAGVVTVAPLLLFTAAAQQLPLSVLGLLQYLNPLIQFAIGVWVLHEAMPTSRWWGFLLIWLALVVMTVDGLRQARRSGQQAAAQREAEVVGTAV